MKRPGLRWYERAICQGQSLQLFYPAGERGSGARGIYRDAARLCARCPVMTECLELALQTEGTAGGDARYGVFGGLTPIERAALAKARRKVAA